VETEIWEKTEMTIEKTILPLKSAYAFGSEHELQAEVDEIRNMEIGWDLAYTSTVRRGYRVELLEKRELWEKFKAEHWAYGNTPGGIKERNRYLRIKDRYDDFLEGKAPAPDELEEEADQQFATEADLRDFLAKNLTCIEAGLRLYDVAGKSGVEFGVEDGRIDILGIDANKRFVALELKLGKGRNKALGQLLYYMGWVDKNLMNGPCRGIILAKDIPDDLVLAVQRVPGVSLYNYKLAVSVELVAPKSPVT
jgi:Endonuclease NucS